jgi:UDP-N-acetylglucosamine 4,6-dehydratase/5-epimerase
MTNPCPRNKSVNYDLNDKTILVTGGTGSFGKQFCRTILERYTPKKLIIFSRDELKQFEMANHADFKDSAVMRYFIGDVRDRHRLEMAFRGVDIVVHAAALKHVPVAEYNPFECIQTNVHGAENVVTAAIHANVEKVIALSTDKAANPINLYGASKLASDKIFVAARNLVGVEGPKFGVVRYGNVIGSRGSVIPFFKNMLEQGASSLPITDDRMTRFWITLQHGVEFVLSSMSMTQGGEIFVPKIPSMKMTDLAHVMAPNTPTNVVGIRPGEKLHEAMITEEDARNSLELSDRYVVRSMLYGDQSGYAEDEVPVEEGFYYASNVNKHWMSNDELRTLLDELKIPVYE